ncbi:MAG TPA: hypothetical protein VGP61_08120 [Gemmatimonadales bacterium]|nr:hypothetical protein [Gemmatimonadales bacterium]
MKQDRSESTSFLMQLCIGYFASYTITGILVKYFTVLREPKLSEMAYLFNNTLGGSAVALLVVLLLGWTKLPSNRLVQWGPFRVPSEVAYIIPSGICTAIVIPTTTLMYSLPISVMVAMVIMRGSIIVISRLVDQVQIGQGILKKRVYRAENLAVVFALLAVATNVLLLPLVDFLEARNVHAAHWIGLKPGAGRGSFDFLHSVPAMSILSLYVVAYAFRLYIMNYYKNTRGKGVQLDNKGFFAIEQIAASVTMVSLAAFFFFSPGLFGWSAKQIVQFHDAVARPMPVAIWSGVPYGIVAFFSVFIFMFKGRTATFAGLVNRLTSLLAGTAATLLLWLFFKTKFPTAQDWVSVMFILVAVYFLSRAEKQRVRELGLVPAVTPEPTVVPLPAGGATVRPR